MVDGRVAFTGGLIGRFFFEFGLTVAGTVFASQNGYARAAECYHKAGRMSVAGEMYEKAGDFAKAGECFVHCDFHRHAAQAFLRAQDWKRAARALEAVVQEEGTRSAGQDPGKARELRPGVILAQRLDVDLVGHAQPRRFVGGVGAGRGQVQWRYSTVTDLARLRGWSTSVPRATAVW